MKRNISQLSSSKKGEFNFAAAPRNVEEDAAYPPTEPGELDNASIFSNSMEFDGAEKLSGANINNGNRGLPEEETELQTYSPMETSAAETSTQDQHPTSALKPRQMASPEPKRWEPLELTVPKDDPDDEFDITSAKNPVFYDETEEKPKIVFEHGEPDLRGEAVSCFDEPGLLYRIVDKKNKIWAFYNDSLTFEVHVSCTFGKHSKIQALENTKLKRQSDGSWIAEVVVYPCETELFIKGFVNGFSSRLRALPISDEYLEERRVLQHEKVVVGEMENVETLVGDETDAEKVLAACVENDVPFVDMEFPPVQTSINADAQRPMKQLPWFRPTMYLREALVKQLRLFRKPIIPGDLLQGELGDCWLMCAIATLAENPEDIMHMFRHPRGAPAARRERTIGAYRVTLNKNGLWSSVIIDDYLPAIAGTPKFARSSDICELWPSILEKAYAKMYSSYGMIQSGDPVHALTDMTGCPSSRFDDAFFKSQKDGGKELFQQLLQYNDDGYQIILTTAGKAPAFIAGTNNHAGVFTENPELEDILGGTGLLPGHAYTVRAVHHFPKDGDLRLMRICNVWGTCEEWKGPWSPNSSEWDTHSNVADACKGDFGGESDIWMDWDHVLKYFNGGGVHFRRLAYDYRVPLSFVDCRPSLVLEVSVDSPVWVCFILANVNYRSLFDDGGHSEVEPRDYPPLMLSLSTTHDGKEGVHKVIQNTSVDAARPSPDKWTFMQAREISMMCKLTPEHSPYLLIPRMMETEETTGGSSAWFAQLQDRVHPLHFANRGAERNNNNNNTNINNNNANNETNESGAEVPVVLGLRCERAVGEEGSGGVRVRFRRLDSDNVVFENFPKFPAETEVVEDVYYQVRAPAPGYAEEKVGATLF